MKQLLRLVLYICLFLITALNLPAQGSVTKNARFTELSLEIRSTKEVFVQLEPIPIIFKLSNNTNHSILGHGSFRFSSNFVSIFMKSPDGSTQEITPLSLDRILSVGKEVLIPPQTQVERSELLKLDLNRYFTVPGIYKLQALFKSRSGLDVIRSSWLAVTITEPHGANLAAYKFLKQGTNVARVYRMHETDEQRNFFEAFVANYENTLYAPYIQMNLAEYYVFAGDFTNAKTKLEKLKGVKDFVFAPEVVRLIKEVGARQRSGK